MLHWWAPSQQALQHKVFESIFTVKVLCLFVFFCNIVIFTYLVLVRFIVLSIVLTIVLTNR